MELNIRRDVVVSDNIKMKLEEMTFGDSRIVKKFIEDLANCENYANGCITDEMLEYFFLPRVKGQVRCSHNEDTYEISRKFAVEVLKNRAFGEGKISFDELKSIFTMDYVWDMELLVFKLMNNASIADKKFSLLEFAGMNSKWDKYRLNVEDFIKLFTSDNFLDGKIPYDIIKFLVESPCKAVDSYKYHADYYVTLYTSKNFGDGIISDEELKKVDSVDFPIEYVDILTSVRYRNRTFSRERMYFAKHGYSMIGKNDDVYKAIKESKAFSEGKITIDDLIDFYEWENNFIVINIIYKLIKLANEFEYTKDELDELIEIVCSKDNVQEIHDLGWEMIRNNGYRNHEIIENLIAKRIFCGKFRPSKEQNVKLGVHKLVRTKDDDKNKMMKV